MDIDQLSPGLAALKGLKGEILLELKRSQPLTARELAHLHSVTPTAVRRHLKELEAEHLVVSRREQRGPGAPTYLYSLSPSGESLFPKRYEEALTAALAFVEKSGGRQAVRQFFAERFGEVAESLKPRLKQASLKERLAMVAEILSREGFMAEWSADEEAVRIAEHNCAVHAVAARFPEVCHAEMRFLEEVLGASVERKQHILSGCNSCEYTVEPECPIQRPSEARPQGEPYNK